VNITTDNRTVATAGDTNAELAHIPNLAIFDPNMVAAIDNNSCITPGLQNDAVAREIPEQAGSFCTGNRGIRLAGLSANRIRISHQHAVAAVLFKDKTAENDITGIRYHEQGRSADGQFHPRAGQFPGRPEI
jgi:hypothetical protein